MIVAITVLYKPKKEHINNINLTSKQVDFHYIIDNTPDKSLEIEIYKNLDLAKAEHLVNKKNLGIATALNIGIQKAIPKGAYWVLTMDQDSQICPDYVNYLVEISKSTGISSLHPNIHKTKSYIDKTSPKLKQIKIAITSGSLISTSLFKQYGLYEDKLFIDWVETDYCLSLKKNGVTIAIVENLFLKHALGYNKKPVKIFGRKYYPANYSPERLYYQSRNRLYIFKKYFLSFPGVCLIILKNWLRDFFLIILAEKQKITKIKYTLFGIIDFMKGKYGGL